MHLVRWCYSPLAAPTSPIFVYPLNAPGTAGTEGGTATDLLSWKWTGWARGPVFPTELWMLWERAAHPNPPDLISIRSAILLNPRCKVSIWNICVKILFQWCSEKCSKFKHGGWWKSKFIQPLFNRKLSTPAKRHIIFHLRQTTLQKEKRSKE